MRRTTGCWAVGLAVLMTMTTVGISRGGDTWQYQSPEELRQACAPYLGPVIPWERKPFRPPSDERYLIVVSYLGHEDPQMQACAADILAEMHRYYRRIRASVFEEYLGAKYPLNVRLVALAYCLSGWSAEGRAMGAAAIWQKYGEPCRDIVNELAMHPVCPANLDIVFLELDTKQFSEVLLPENQVIMLRRLLALVSSEAVVRHRNWVELMASLDAFPDDLVTKEVCEWYRVEPDRNARKAIVSYFDGLDAKRKQEQKAIVELASQDWDPEIAGRARAATW